MSTDYKHLRDVASKAVAHHDSMHSDITACLKERAVGALAELARRATDNELRRTRDMEDMLARVEELEKEVDKLTFLSARSVENDEHTSADGHGRQRFLCGIDTKQAGGGYAPCEKPAQLRALLREALDTTAMAVSPMDPAGDLLAKRIAAIRTAGGIADE